jgi:osmotically-inducible protein OsmY
MHLPPTARALLLLVCAAVLTDCSVYHTYEQCGLSGSASDVAITNQVEALFSQHPALGAPNQVRVRTCNGVVYLTGLVSTDLQRSTAESLAHTVPNVRQVVNTISFENIGM